MKTGFQVQGLFRRFGHTRGYMGEYILLVCYLMHFMRMLAMMVVHPALRLEYYKHEECSGLLIVGWNFAEYAMYLFQPLDM